MSDDGKKMLQNVEAELRIGIPKGTSMWPLPRKPMSQPKGPGQAKPGAKSPKGVKGVKGPKSKAGPKSKKHIFAGWD